jgi:thiosulfate/3-mercaptopyruvate sulfurtransferase
MADEEAIVDPSWLAAHAGDPRVRVVEVDVSAAAYDAGHIPGAALWNAYTDLRGPDYIPVERPALEALLSRSGISPGTTLVFCGYAAALGFWLMKSHGHGDARILSGSREQWADAVGGLTTPTPDPAASAYPLRDPDPDLLVSRSAAGAAISEPGCVLLDVRSQEEFSGERFWPSGASEDTGRAGRMPGAVSVPIELLRNDDDTFKPAAELRRVLHSADVRPEQRVITYCTIGNRASQAWFALTRLLDYRDVGVYYGSWAEWGKASETPVER